MSSTKGLSYFFVKNIVLCGFVWSDPSIISKPLDAPKNIVESCPSTFYRPITAWNSGVRPNRTIPSPFLTCPAEPSPHSREWKNKSLKNFNHAKNFPIEFPPAFSLTIWKSKKKEGEREEKTIPTAGGKGGGKEEGIAVLGQWFFPFFSPALYRSRRRKMRESVFSCLTIRKAGGANCENSFFPSCGKEKEETRFFLPQT